MNNTGKKMKMASLFAGIGGFELGFQRVGIETILSCEVDSTAQYVLHEQMPKSRIVGDIRELKDLPAETDILCAGFPCQDISTIGVKTGLAGDRSSLVREVFRLLKRHKVEWVIFENVSNMLHLKNGETIQTIVGELNDLGYHWAYRMINSIAFVPQSRKRVYVVASLHHDPADVLLSGDAEYQPGVITSDDFVEPCGFYWTEGKYAIGLYQNAIPTLKVGSTIGIASPPAIAFPNGEIGSPDIRDAEKFQGFPADWTEPAEDVAKPSVRWKLVGNAVTVDVVTWIANKMLRPVQYEKSNDVEMKIDSKWPNAGWGYKNHRFQSKASVLPVYREEISLTDFLQYPCKELSYKAAKGFESRLISGTVHCPRFFVEAVHDYVEQKGIENAG